MTPLVLLALLAGGPAAARAAALPAGTPIPPPVGRAGPPRADTARVLRVGAGSPYGSIRAALADARPGDTVRVGPGVYHGSLLVDRPVTLLGTGRPVVDGGGRGHVVEITAPGVTVRGFTLRASGENPEREDAGVMVRAGPVRIVDDRLEDVQYGIYLKDAPGSLVQGNVVRGKPFPLARRGDGIRLWYSSSTRIAGNDVAGARDVVVFFSDHLRIEDNHVTGGRYGLHYMYSNHNRIEGNRLEGNEVGAFIMYSKDITLRRNVFGRSHGSSGFGIGLKDSDSLRVRDNLFAANQVGVYLDNSPHSVGVENVLEGNVFLYNEAAVRLLPSVHSDRFTGNSFVDNGRPADIPGGAVRGGADQNDWSGNYWSGYAGFDADDDGVGDTPFSYARLTDDLVSRVPELRIFDRSPAFPVLDALSRFFPLLRPEPVVVDSVPRLEAAALERWRADPPVAAEASGGGRGGRTGPAILWVAAGVAGVAGAAVVRPGRTR